MTRSLTTADSNLCTCRLLADLAYGCMATDHTVRR